MTLTNNTKRLYASLSTAKGRRESGLFMAQGTKCVLDTIGHSDVRTIIATDGWLTEHPDLAGLYDISPAKAADIQRITTLSTPPEVIGIYRIPETPLPEVSGKLTVALDGIQDPGNLGTIMRVADWMGVTDIIASADTVDVYNPKVVQATMGAIARVNVHYVTLDTYLAGCQGLPIYGTYLDGDSIYSAPLSPEGIIVMGNEGNGIRPATARHITRRLYIPPYPSGHATSESLNVAVATAITLAEFRRRMASAQ